MIDWPTAPIGQVARVFDGPHATPKTVDAGPIFLGISALNRGRIVLSETRHVTLEDFQTWTRRVRPQAEDIVFSYETRIGEAAIIPQGLECCLGRRMALVRVDRAQLHPRFFLYVYLSPTFQELLRSRTITGATVDRIALTEFPNFPIPLPPVFEQTAIASILGNLDDKIDLNRRMNETLEAMARAVFKDWFVDFGPTRAKMEGRTPYLAPEVWALFPDRLDDEGKPEGWKTRRWGEIATLEYGKRIEGYRDRRSGIPVYGTNGPIGWHDVALSDEPGVIIGRKGAYRGVHFADGPFTVIDTAFYLQLLGCRSQRWAYYLVSTYDINGMDSGSAIPSTSREAFYALPVVDPPDALQSCFERTLAPTWERQKINEAEATTLRQMRDLLLPKLMSGEIRVKDALKIAEAAA